MSIPQVWNNQGEVFGEVLLEAVNKQDQISNMPCISQQKSECLFLYLPKSTLLVVLA